MCILPEGGRGKAPWGISNRREGGGGGNLCLSKRQGHIIRPGGKGDPGTRGGGGVIIGL